MFLRENKDIRAAIVEQVFERGLGIAVTPGPTAAGQIALGPWVRSLIRISGW